MATSIIDHAQYVNIVATTVVAKDGKYLMVQENKPAIKGLWNFLSGKAELGETITQAAEREAHEESGGLEIKVTDLLEVVYELWQDGNGVTVKFVFWGEVVGGNQGEVASDIQQAEWKTQEELYELKAQGKLRNLYIERLVGVVASGRRLPLDVVYQFTNDFKFNNLSSR